MELNDSQRAAVEYYGGHVLVLAGAGTGKTRTIIARAAHLIENGVDPRRILLLTFTRRAAKEMIDRLFTLIGQKAAIMQAGTFHHYALYTMRRMPGYFGIEGATIIDRDDQIQLVKLIRADYKQKGIDFPKASELVSLISYARNTLQPIEDYLYRHTHYDGDIREKIGYISKQFDQRKQENNYLDYDDILFRFAQKIHEDSEIRRRLQGFYDHILVDEMQDTNPLQWSILDGLRDPAILFCVGDDAQSIYAFRGADFRNVHSFQQRIPESTVMRLEKNYRSTQGILNLSNWLLDQSGLNYNKRLHAHRKTQTTPQLKEFSSEFEEARWVAEDLLKRRKNGATWTDHMIITRTGYGARTVESFMIEKRIPYRFLGGISILQTAHVKDLLSMIRLSVNHRDELAWARYLTMWPRIGNATADKLIKGLYKKDTVVQALEHLRKSLKTRPEIIDGPASIITYLKDPATAIRKAAQFLLPLMQKRYDNWQIRIRDFDLLTRLAAEHNQIEVFIETYTLDPVSVSTADQFDADDIVTLTTVHSAKGTEAPVCYLIRTEKGMYPHFHSKSIEDIEEERRILYVAMTRAQDELIITRSRKPRKPIFPPEEMGYKETYFLDQLDESLIEKDGDVFQPTRYDDPYMVQHSPDDNASFFKDKRW